MQTFLSESQIYELLSRTGFITPKYRCCQTLDAIDTSLFSEGEEIVIKGEVDQVFHKSDIGLVQIGSYSVREAQEYFKKWQSKFGERFKSLLLIEKVSFKSISSFPCEIFLSVRFEASYGHVARLGIGGVQSEYWGKRNPPLIITKDRSMNDILEELSYHLMGHIWFGLLRQKEALVTVEMAKEFIKSILTLLHRDDLPNLLEINPMVVTTDDRIVALDGVGVEEESYNITASERSVLTEALLRPTSIAIAGVSTKKVSFGNMILNNIVKSSLEKKNIKIIKDGLIEFEGIGCLSSIKDLQIAPVSNLILALPPKGCISTIEQLCEQGCGAEIVYLVAGGIGDGADLEGLGLQLQEYLSNRQAKNLWCPQVVGPNSLGIILAPLKLNTLFIPESKLEVKFAAKGNIAFLSQSGAFFITRLSNMTDLPLKYAFCIGNQLDLTMGELLSSCAEDLDISVFSIYLEGLKNLDLKRLEQKIGELVFRGAKVIIYKGGRSEEGSKAAAGHTGAIAGSYDFEFDILTRAGAMVCNTMEEFSGKTKFYSAYKNSIESVGVISNAGFETVCGADIFDSRLKTLSSTTLKDMDSYFTQHKLSHLVHAANPLDLTPMANEVVYLSSAELMLQEVDLLVVAAVPLTERLCTNGESAVDFARGLLRLEQKYNKPIVIVIDSGTKYNEYRRNFSEQGLLTLTSLEQVKSLL